jgi:hypothetical protein
MTLAEIFEIIFNCIYTTIIYYTNKRRIIHDENFDLTKPQTITELKDSEIKIENESNKKS